MDAPRPLPPVELVQTKADDSSTGVDSVPATRKSLTEFDTTQLTAKPPDSGNTEVASNPPIQSQVPATLASAPLTTAVVADHIPEVKVVGANEVGKSATSTLPMHSKLGGSSKRNAFIAAGGLVALLGVGAVYLRPPPPPASPTTPEVVPSQTTKVLTPEPTTITLRATVTPSDARILVDGRYVGAAGDAIVLPREKKERAIRIERKGYEPQTMWVPVHSDKQIGPITLVALPVTPVASASASNKKPVAAPSGKAVTAPSGKAVTAPSGKAVTTKTKVNKELFRPKEFGAPK